MITLGGKRRPQPRTGPTVVLKVTCDGCAHLCAGTMAGERACSHPRAPRIPGKKRVDLLTGKAMTNSTITPEWCPVLASAVDAQRIAYQTAIIKKGATR